MSPEPLSEAEMQDVMDFYMVYELLGNQFLKYSQGEPKVR